jgi:hypothetical protein
MHHTSTPGLSLHEDEERMDVVSTTINIRVRTFCFLRVGVQSQHH